MSQMTDDDSLGVNDEVMNASDVNLAKFLAFVEAREETRIRRAAGGPPPWTDDPIIANYRFCNIYREDDATTVWLRENWREPYADHPDLWHAMLVARHINKIDTLAELGGPVLPWDPDKVRAVFADRKSRGLRNFSGAYMIHCKQHGDKLDYLCKFMFDYMWNAREKLRPHPGDSLNGWHTMIGALYGMGSFITAQVIADIKYTGVMREASDWHTFAASGPGSRRGMNWVLGRPRKANWAEDDWRLALGRLREQIAPFFVRKGWQIPDGQNSQNILCEYDKYSRTLTGMSRPKQRFNAMKRYEEQGMFP